MWWVVAVLPLAALLCCGDGGGSEPSRAGVPAGRDGAQGVPAPRSVEPVAHETPGQRPGPPAPVSLPPPGESCGVFVGCATFADRSISEVKFATDDAVDLAYRLWKDLGLLRPGCVAVLLSGKPEKIESRQRLESLRQAGALIGAADANSIYQDAGRETLQVGSGGILFLAFSTHGYSADGEHHLLTADSTRGDPQGVRADRLMQITRPQHDALRVVFLDACRSPGRGGAPGAGGSAAWPDPHTEMSRGLLDALAGKDRHAVFSGAGPGGIALADSDRGNGFFTGAVLDALRCEERPNGADADGLVTLPGLASFVNGEVPRRTNGQQVPEVSLGGVGDFVLRQCFTPVLGEILEPKEGGEVVPNDKVTVRILRSGFYPVAVVKAMNTGQFYPQGSTPAAAPSREGDLVELSVQYGAPDQFGVYVGLTSDRQLFSSKVPRSLLPSSDGAGRPVHWLGPVNVVLSAPHQ